MRARVPLLRAELGTICYPDYHHCTNSTKFVVSLPILCSLLDGRTDCADPRSVKARLRLVHLNISGAPDGARPAPTKRLGMQVDGMKHVGLSIVERSSVPQISKWTRRAYWRREVVVACHRRLGSRARKFVSRTNTQPKSDYGWPS
jgi:hypothetical protein